MKYINNINSVKLHNTVVTIGKFDGYHLGHQLLLDKVSELKRDDMSTVILTFGNEIFAAYPYAKNIFSSSEKLSYEYSEEIDYLIELSFNKIKDISPEDFVLDFLVDKLGVKKLVVGSDFRFGKSRSGDVETLRRLGSIYGFDAVILDKIKYNNEEISSTRIKSEIQKGNIYEVNEMLGHPYSITGVVVKGKQLGRTIGFPTMNIAYNESKVLPPDGGYATMAYVDGRKYESITNIGLNPTVGGTKRTIETYVFDFNKDVYGKTARIEFYKFLRSEKKFDSLDELKMVIENDVKDVKEFFKKM